jgi:hypothetical protein
MALSAEEAAKLQKKLQEIERLSRLLGANINTINLQDLEKQSGNIEFIFERLTKQAAGLGEETDYLVSNFQKLIGEIKKTSAGVSETSKGLRNLSSITEQISNYQKGYNNLSSKEIAKLKAKVEIEADRLKTAKNTLKEEAIEISRKIQSNNLQGKALQFELAKLNKIILARKNISQLLRNEDITLGELNNQLDIAEKNIIHMEKTLGLTGDVLKGISKIPILGNIVDTQKALKAAEDYAKEAGEGATRMGAMSAAMGSLGEQIRTKLTDPLTITVFLITKTVEAFKRVDSAVGQLAKDFNLTYSDALKTRQELTQIAALSNDAAVNTRGLQESMVAIGKALGSNAMLNKQDLVFMTKMREQAGFTNEELVEMQKLTFATGGTLESNTKNLLFAAKTTGLNNKVLLNEKDIMRDVAKASNAVKLSVVGGAEGLGRAAAQAKALGMNLNQLDGIASGLLDFESSINAELEAQLLTGKDINLEQARLYALNNDMEGLSREIAKNVGTAAEFGKMNRLQQESVAKAVGMTREELATTLTDQKALQGLSGKAAEDAKKALAGARARGMTEEEIREKGIKDLMSQQSTQEKFNQAMEKLQDIIGNLVNGPFGLFLEGLSKGLDIIGKIFAKFGQISGIIKGFLGDKVGDVLGGIASIATIGTLIALVTKSMLKGTIINPMVVTIAGSGGAGGAGGGAGDGMFSGGLGRLGKAFKGGGMKGAGKAAGRILSKTAKSNALTALIMGGLEAGSNIAEGKGAGESLGRAALSGLFSLGGGVLGSLVAPGAGTIGGGIAGGMLGDKVGDMLFGEKVQDAIINPDGGLRVSGPKGAFSLDKNDTVIAGTDLNKAKGGAQTDNSPMITELREIKNILQRTYNLDVAQGLSNPLTAAGTGLDLLVDKLGTKVNMNTYKTQ